jgi:hypothetical protein
MFGQKHLVSTHLVGKAEAFLAAAPPGMEMALAEDSAEEEVRTLDCVRICLYRLGPNGYQIISAGCGPNTDRTPCWYDLDGFTRVSPFAATCRPGLCRAWHSLVSGATNCIHRTV